MSIDWEKPANYTKTGEIELVDQPINIHVGDKVYYTTSCLLIEYTEERPERFKDNPEWKAYTYITNKVTANSKTHEFKYDSGYQNEGGSLEDIANGILASSGREIKDRGEIGGFKVSELVNYPTFVEMVGMWFYIYPHAFEPDQEE